MTRIIGNTQETAQYDWPEDCFIQGGGRGVVFRGDDPSYRTAFFEAFPGGTFLRGEGETLAEAETDCWQKYQLYVSCEHGPFERRKYRNGSGFCTKCGLWMSKVFEPLPEEPRKDGRRSMLERLFVDADPEALHEVLDSMVNSDELPTKREAQASDEG